MLRENIRRHGRGDFRCLSQYRDHRPS